MNSTPQRTLTGLVSERPISVCAAFYNALGFADSILHATEAVHENEELIGLSLWIIDEFQDFNAAEEQLIVACVSGARGVLLAGEMTKLFTRSSRRVIQKSSEKDMATKQSRTQCFPTRAAAVTISAWARPRFSRGTAKPRQYGRCSSRWCSMTLRLVFELWCARHRILPSTMSRPLSREIASESSSEEMQSLLGVPRIRTLDSELPARRRCVPPGSRCSPRRRGGGVEVGGSGP
jgi:hypothetical protein